jgi:hypothetical protein
MKREEKVASKSTNKEMNKAKVLAIPGHCQGGGGW